VLVEDHARKILKVTGGEPKPRVIICDHDAEDRATLERHLKMPTRAAWKFVGPGIQAVEARLRKAGDGKPRLMYMEGSLVEVDTALLAAHKPICTTEEVECYVWDESNNRKRGEEPVKKYDHGMDRDRYLVTHVDDTSGKRPKFFPLNVSDAGTSDSGGSEGGSLSQPSSWRMGGETGYIKSTRWGGIE